MGGRNPAPAIHEGLADRAVEAMEAATPDEQAFALEVAKGSTASAAFRKVFPALAANWAETTLWSKASRLSNSDKVRIWVREYRMSGAALNGDGRLNHAQHVGRLVELSHKAEETGNYGASVVAEVNAGKASGLYDKQPETEDTRQPDQIRKELADLLNISPDELTAPESGAE